MAVAQDHWAARWVPCSNGEVPPGAFVYEDYNIARAQFQGGLQVGYVSREQRGCVISWGGKEHVISTYEVLTGDQNQFRWVSFSGGGRPQNFIPLKGGYEADGKELYIAMVNGHIGKAGQALYIRVMDKNFMLMIMNCWRSYNFTVSKEIPFGEDSKEATTWVRAHDGHIPPNAFHADFHSGQVIARAHFEGGIHVGYVEPSRGGCVIGWGGKEYLIHEYEVLTGDQNQFRWHECSGATRPQFFIPLKAGQEKDGKELYIAKANGRIGKSGKHLIDGMSYACDGREYREQMLFQIDVTDAHVF
ncbi:5025_t:CDS:10 [Acaulospora morrowiae]|uniref:5025_t:CDS:1 n=1 Tax=Acaulospora morrowiae TaxID=94023 RepID=A0A9N9H516_9GLOM|nr:5025_t:CDS:10 [Acaulospora morrowiae]